ncbi:hypothetical protein V6N13_048896 [Hibiscus sabdariffa]
MSLTANLLGPPSSFDLVIPGGRPPDIILVIPEGIVRERSVSPTSFGDGTIRMLVEPSHLLLIRLEDMDDEQVQDGNRVNLVHEGEVAAPRIGNDEFAKQGLPHTVSKNATHKLSNPDRKGRAAKKRKKFIGDHRVVSDIEHEVHGSSRVSRDSQRRKLVSGKDLHFREPMMQSSDDESFYRSDSPEVLPEGTVFEDD